MALLPPPDHGRRIARIVPESDRRELEIDAAIDSMAARRRRSAGITVEQLISARDEGRTR